MSCISNCSDESHYLCLWPLVASLWEFKSGAYSKYRFLTGTLIMKTKQVSFYKRNFSKFLLEAVKPVPFETYYCHKQTLPVQWREIYGRNLRDRCGKTDVGVLTSVSAFIKRRKIIRASLRAGCSCGGVGGIISGPSLSGKLNSLETPQKNGGYLCRLHRAFVSFSSSQLCLLHSLIRSRWRRGFLFVCPLCGCLAVMMSRSSRECVLNVGFRDERRNPSTGPLIKDDDCGVVWKVTRVPAWKIEAILKIECSGGGGFA